MQTRNAVWRAPRTVVACGGRSRVCARQCVATRAVRKGFRRPASTAFERGKGARMRCPAARWELCRPVVHAVHSRAPRGPRCEAATAGRKRRCEKRSRPASREMGRHREGRTRSPASPPGHILPSFRLQQPGTQARWSSSDECAGLERRTAQPNLRCELHTAAAKLAAAKATVTVRPTPHEGSGGSTCAFDQYKARRKAAIP